MNKIKAIFLLLLSSPIMANYTHPAVDRLLQSDNTPEGVVFELIENDKKTWEWAAPMVKELRDQLKEKYPNIEIAIVSHGREQFQLLKKRAKKQPQAIATLQDLVHTKNVNLHVCGAHSSWFGIDPSAYINFVDVTDSGPAMINNYIDLGYQPIQLYKPNMIK